MNIKAKMKCDSVEKAPNDAGETVTLSAVYSDDPNNENYSYSVATPSANLRMFIANEAAFGAFEQGKEYVVTFAPA